MVLSALLEKYWSAFVNVRAQNKNLTSYCNGSKNARNLVSLAADNSSINLLNG
jgi:hypothetical protein